jgi:DNA-binding response OmpR family regulator
VSGVAFALEADEQSTVPPLRAAAPVADSASERRGGEPARPRVLVADDEPAMRLLLRVNLGLAGFDVTDVGDGEAVLAALDRQPFELVILDVMMPGLGGHSVAPRLVAAGTPFVFVSARASLEDQRAGYEIGALDYIVKPFDAIEIGERLREVLARVRRERLRRLTAPG